MKQTINKIIIICEDITKKYNQLSSGINGLKFSQEESVKITTTLNNILNNLNILNQSNVIINQALSTIEKCSDEVNTLLTEATNISKQLDNILGIESNIPDDDTGNSDSGNEELPEETNQTPLTFTAGKGGATISIVKPNDDYPDISETDLKYRNSATEKWLDYELGTVISLKQEGDMVQFKGIMDGVWGYSHQFYPRCQMTGIVYASGNIQSILNYSISVPDNYFGNFFVNCSSLITPPELPATNLASHCYNNMFAGCTSLTQAPALPATKLANYCYGGMFSRCTSLVQAPGLPATKLAENCYNSMFYKCTSLTQAPELPATELARWCYSSMFESCTSLTQAPELIATKLVYNCFDSMFNGCKKLNYIKVNFTEWGSGETDVWVSGVSSTGTFIKPSTLPEQYGLDEIPDGWTVVNED